MHQIDTTHRIHQPTLKRLLYYVIERQRIYITKEARRPKPWTKDQILQRYSFCNVFREQDRVTKWVHKHIRMPFAHSRDLWFMLCIARLLNRPDTLQELISTTGAWPQPRGQGWNYAGTLKVLQRRKARGDKVFTGAYIVSTNGLSMDKAEYVVTKVLEPLWADRTVITGIIRPGVTLAAFHERLSGYNGMGSFLSAQVIADFKHCSEQHLADAKDWYDWAASGPGSRRGLNRVYGRAKEAPWKEREWLRELPLVRGMVEQALHRDKLIPKKARLCLQDAQNCLCEFDKYERTRLGEGRPRTTYPGTPEAEEAEAIKRGG